MPKKLDYEFVKQKFTERNYELLESNYINSKEKMRYKCLIHPDKELYITYNGLQKGNGCKFCASEKGLFHFKKTHNEFIQELKQKNPNITVLDKYINSSSKIKVKCNLDGHIWTVLPTNLLKTNNPTGCPVCAGKSVELGINSIVDTHPNIAKLFVNQDLATKVSYGSEKEADFLCPVCNLVSTKIIKSVTKQGFKCNFCSPNISFPERFISSLLNYLNIPFKARTKIDWSLNKEYDIYIQRDSIIIEMHGSQHYIEKINSNWRSLKEEQENDNLKKELAYQNNIKNYIVIDSRISEADFIKNNILNSKLSELYDLTNVNWQTIEEWSATSLIKKSCELWNSNITIVDISKKLDLHPDTIRSYLKNGTKLGLCYYNPSIDGKRVQNIKKSKARICLTTKEVFPSAKIAEDYYKIYGAYSSGITNSCNKKQISSGKLPTGEKLIWEYYNPDIHKGNFIFVGFER